MKEYIKFAFSTLRHHRSRSVLTILGVVIGMAAVVSLMTLGNALTETVEDNLNDLGANNVFVTPSGFSFSGSGPPSSAGVVLKESDLDRIQRIKGVETAIGAYFTPLPISYKDKTLTIQISGVPGEEFERFFSDLQNFEIEEGRFIKDNDNSGIVIGSAVAEAFDEDIKINSKLEILGKNFKVVGILKEIGNMQDDFSITMTLDSLQRLTDRDDELTALIARAVDDPVIVSERIEEYLDDKYGERLFRAITSEQVIENINGVFGGISLVLASIAGVSLVVAGFGIMNTMLVSVLERTKEIGVMKAVGATNLQIVLIFLAESAIVGFFGGLIWVIIGYLVSFALASITSNLVGITLVIKLDIIIPLLALSFSTIVGILSGTYPALKAARLNPVEALRYE